MKRLINVVLILSLVVCMAASVSAKQVEDPVFAESFTGASPRTILEWTETYSKILPTYETVYATVHFRYNDSYGDIVGISSVKYSCSSSNISGLQTVATKILGDYATITFGYTYVPTGVYMTNYVYVYAPN